MEYTREQLKLVEAAKAAGKRSVMLEYTPEQLADWEAARDLAMAEKPEIIARFHRMKAAEGEDTFSGRLRRAIRASKQDAKSLAEEIDVDWRLLDDFRSGDATLPSDVVDRLIAALGLRLVQDIPAASTKRPS